MSTERPVVADPTPVEASTPVPPAKKPAVRASNDPRKKRAAAKSATADSPQTPAATESDEKAVKE